MPRRKLSLGHRLALFIHTRMTPMVKHPATVVTVGISMLVTGLSELLEDVLTNFESLLQSYHGLVIFGLVTAMRGVSEMVEALEWLDRDFEVIVEGDEAPNPMTDDNPAIVADPETLRPGRAA